ncbi:hypothetical protein [Streptomyces sp. NPDC059215]|uniref:hypothetical protein n=1 Tax=Streptomyces sp. NPDC059215 TaxID=3346772 RepID=UPI0036B53F42
MLTTAQVRDHIHGLPDIDSLLAVQEAATTRLLQLDTARKPVITPGRTCRITDSIRPAVLRGLSGLSGLSGTVQQPNRTGTRFDILLDQESTTQLRNRQSPLNPRFKIADGIRHYRLAGPRRMHRPHRHTG